MFHERKVLPCVVRAHNALHGVDVNPNLGRESTSPIVSTTTTTCRVGVAASAASGLTWPLVPVVDVGGFVSGLASESSAGRGSGTKTPGGHRTRIVGSACPLPIEREEEGDGR